MNLPVSRALLLPGPIPPLSHFGVTLLRHVVVGGLRYSLYQLGLEPPEKPPVRIVALRLYLEGQELAEALADGAAVASPWTEEVAAALTLPGGAAPAAPPATGPRGACLFHRARLRLPLGSRRAPRAPRVLDAAATPLWQLFRQQLQAELPALRDAMLGELLASLARRRRRAGGSTIEPCLGRQASRLRRGRRADLGCLGDPDPRGAAWAASPERAAAARQAFADTRPPPSHRWRGRFREAYRATLERLRIPFLELATTAADRGLIESADDAFFIPFDLGHELTGEAAPAWLAPAIAANRREYDDHYSTSPPPDLILDRTVALGGSGGGAGGWELGPLTPLD